MTAEEVPVVEKLRDLGIAFERHEHPPVATVEQAAEHWAGIDEHLARAERLLWSTASLVERYHAQLMACAPDDDPIPAGTGPCVLKLCEHFCNPRKNPNDRLKRGLCPTHYKLWQRSGNPGLEWLDQYLRGEGAA